MIQRLVLHRVSYYRPGTRRGVLFSTTSSRCSDIVQGPSLLRTSVGERHRPRPSLLHLPGLRALPFWTAPSSNKNSNSTTAVAYQDPQVTRAVEHLEAHWQDIRAEYQAVAPSVPSDYQTDTEHHTLHQGAGWDWRSYLRQGHVEPNFGRAFPTTTAVLEGLDDLLFAGTPFGYAFFSTLHGQSRIQAHTAPMNLRLRVHLPLVVPPVEEDGAAANDNKPKRPACGIRVGPVTRRWEAGRALVLDDSFEHEVWNDTHHARVLLLVDLWHPDVAAVEREEIRQMFGEAQKKGWLSAAPSSRAGTTATR